VIAELGPVLDRYRRHHPHESDTLIHRAYDVAAAAHDGQFRHFHHAGVNRNDA